MASFADLLLLLRADTADVDSKLKATTRELNQTARKFESVGDALTSAGAKLSAGVTLPIIAAGGAMVKVALDFDDATDNIRIGTGATGEALESLSKSMREVFRTVPTDIGSASTAISDLSTRLGLTGKPLESLSAQMLNLSRLTKTDLQPLIASTTRVFGDWSVSTDKQASTLDYLFKVSQSTGIGVDRLSEQVVAFGAPLRQMGFGLDTSAALLGKFEKEGVNAELVMGSLRIALTRMARAGVDDASQALTVLSNEIKNAGSTGEANRKAIELFGAKAGPDMAAAIREGRFEIGELVKQLEDSPESINGAAKATDGFSEKLTQLRNRAALVVEPLGVKIIEALDRIIERSGPVIKTVEGMVEKFSNLPTPVQDAALGFGALLAAIGPVVFVFGQIAGSIGNVIKLTKDLLPLLVTLRTSMAGLGGAFTVAGLAAVSFGAAALATQQNLKRLEEQADSFAEKVRQKRILELGNAGKSIEQMQAMGFTLDQIKAAYEGASLTASNFGSVTADLGITVVTAGKNLKGLADDASKVPPPFDHIDLSASKAKDKLVTFGEVLKSLQLSDHNRKIEETARFYLSLIDPIEKAERRQVAWATTLRNSEGAIAAVRDELDAMVDAEIRASAATVDLGSNLQGLNLPATGIAKLVDDLRSLGVVLDQDVNSKLENLEEIFGRTTEAARKGQLTAEDAARAEIKVLEARKAAGVATDEEIRKLEALQRVMGGVEQAGVSAAKKQETAWQSFGRQVSTIITDMSRGIADVIIKGGKLGDVFKDVGEQIVTALVRTVIERGINEVLKSLDGLLDRLGGVGGAIGKVFGSTPGATTPPFLGGAIPGLGGSTNAGVSATGAAGSPLGGASGGGFAAATSSVLGAVGAVGAVVGAISGIIGNFQMARQENTLNAIEGSTRITAIGILGPRGLLDMTFEVMANVQAIEDAVAGWMHDAWVDLLDTMHEIRDLQARIGSNQPVFAGAGGETIINWSGNIVIQGTSDPSRTAEEVARVLKRRSSQFN